jgi:hypothetical protein
MSGQPSKRRKLSKEKKPRGEVRDVIADALQVPYLYFSSQHNDVSDAKFNFLKVLIIARECPATDFLGACTTSKDAPPPFLFLNAVV